MTDIIQFKSNRDLIREKIIEYWVTKFDREPTEQEIKVNMERIEFFQKDDLPDNTNKALWDSVESAFEKKMIAQTAVDIMYEYEDKSTEWCLALLADIFECDPMNIIDALESSSR